MGSPDPALLDTILLGDDVPEAKAYEVWWQLYLEGLDTAWADDAPVPPEFVEDAYPASTNDFPPEGFHHRRHALDFADSLFGFYRDELESSDLAILDEHAAVRTDYHLFVRGASLPDLRPLLSWDTSDLQRLSPIYALVRTDGSLADAMRHATFRADGPLCPFDRRYGEVDPSWAERLRAIDDVALREHAEMLCQSAQAARCTGARFSSPGRLPEELENLGRLPVARWDFGEGQGALLVLARP